MIKLTTQEYMNFKIAYFNGKWGHLRFGQAFLNSYFSTVPDAEVYYGLHFPTVEKLILEKYVDYGTAQAQ